MTVNVYAYPSGNSSGNLVGDTMPMVQPDFEVGGSTLLTMLVLNTSRI
jgi:hypothetical protein